MIDAIELAALYPSMAPAGTGGQAPPAPAATPEDPMAHAEAVLYGGAGDPPKVSAEPNAVDVHGTAENALYGSQPQGDGVRYDEPPIGASDAVPVELPGEMAERVDAAEMGQVKAAFREAGLGLTLTGALVARAVEVARTGPLNTTADQGYGALVQKFGQSGADAKIEAARGLVEKAATKWPGIHSFLEASGLANCPRLVEQLAARAAKAPRSGWR